MTMDSEHSLVWWDKSSQESTISQFHQSVKMYMDMQWNFFGIILCLLVGYSTEDDC